MNRLVWLALIQLSFCHAFAQSSGGGADTFPPGKTLIEAQVMTNWVERGITQTDSTPSIHAAVGYKWPQFRVGVWGSNFRAAPSEDNVNIRIFGAYKFIITNNFDLTARADLSNYFSSGTANGSVLSVDVNFYTYHVDLEQVANWEGTGDSLMRMGFRKDFKFGSGWVWGVSTGYDSPAATTVVGYLDFLTSFGYQLQDMRFDFAVSATTNSTQLNARGKPAVMLIFSVMPE